MFNIVALVFVVKHAAYITRWPVANVSDKADIDML